MIQDLEQFYERPSETYVRRAAAMFTSNPPPASATPTSSPTAAARPSSPTSSSAPNGRLTRSRRPSAHSTASPTSAHMSALQRSSRAPDDQGDPHPRRRARVRLARRPRRLPAAEAALQHLRPDGRLLRHHAPQPGLARPRPAVRTCRPRTSAWSASSRPRVGRTSSCRPAATAPSRCSSSPKSPISGASAPTTRAPYSVSARVHTRPTCVAPHSSRTGSR